MIFFVCSECSFSQYSEEICCFPSRLRLIFWHALEPSHRSRPPPAAPPRGPEVTDAPAPAYRKRWLDSDEARGLALISPTLLYAMAMLLLPVAIIVVYSFWSQNYLTIDHTFRLDNYRAALTEPIYRDLFLRSLGISLTVSLVTVLMAYPAAWYISFHGGRNKNLWLFLITVPFLTSYLLRVMSWKVILGYEGVLNSVMVSTGILHEPTQALLYNANSVVITLVHSWVAFAILPIFVSLEKIDRSLIEAGQDLGDSGLTSLLRIVLPLSMPGVISAFLIVMIPTVGDYVTPKLVGGNEGTMIASAIEVNFGRALNWPLGAALSVTTMVLVSAAAGLMVLLLRLLVRVLR